MRNSEKTLLDKWLLSACIHTISLCAFVHLKVHPAKNQRNHYEFPNCLMILSLSTISPTLVVRGLWIIGTKAFCIIVGEMVG